jgi:Flp pilus assembly protein TadG
VRQLARRFFAGFAKACRATAGVEFALILPIALILYVGAAEVADGVMTSRKLTEVARTLVDLTSDQPTYFQATSSPTPAAAVTQQVLSTILSSAATLLYPERQDTLQMTLSAVDVVNDGTGHCCVAKVRWSFAQRGMLRPCNTNLTGAAADAQSPATLPAPLLPIGLALPEPLSYLISDVRYTYQPALGSAIFVFAPPMSRMEAMIPRSTGQVIAGPLSDDGIHTGQVCY